MSCFPNFRPGAGRALPGIRYNTCRHILIYFCIYIYAYRVLGSSIHTCIYIYTYIYIDIWRWILSALPTDNDDTRVGFSRLEAFSELHCSGTSRDIKDFGPWWNVLNGTSNGGYNRITITITIISAMIIMINHNDNSHNNSNNRIMARYGGVLEKGTSPKSFIVLYPILLFD